MDRTGTRRIIVAQSVRGTGSRRVVEVEGATLENLGTDGLSDSADHRAARAALLLGEEVGVDPLDLERVDRRHADVVIDHERGERGAVDEDDLDKVDGKGA